MDLKTVVYYAAMFLQLEDVTEALESDSEYIGETADEIDRLTRCANLVLSETAADYMPLKTREEIYCENGEMLFTQLSKPVIDVFSVSSAAGVTVPFKQYFDRLILPKEGSYTVEYGYAPEKLALDDPLPYTERVSARVIAYGTACEYCIISGMTDEAVLWDKRYKDALHLAAIQKSEKRVAKRRWQ